MAGRQQPADGRRGFLVRIHMTIAALQASRSMCTVRERRTRVLMTVGTEGVYILSFYSLRMRIVTGFALNARFAVLARFPFIRGGCMALGTQRRIRGNGHLRLRVSGLIHSVARLARHTFQRI